MGTHTEPTSHWVEAGWSRLTIALWEHTLDQHHTGLRQVELVSQYDNYSAACNISLL